jgi:hypothetical protein
MNAQIIKLGHEYKALKVSHDELTEKLKETDANWQDIETQLLDAMVDEGVKSIDIEGVGKLSMRVTNYLSVNAASKPKFFEYLKASGNGDLLKLDVNPRTLTAFLGKHAEELEAEIIKNDGLDQVSARTLALDRLKAEGANYFTKRDIALRS